MPTTVKLPRIDIAQPPISPAQERMSAPSHLKVKCIRNEARFMALQDSWNALAKKTNVGNVFLRHEWFVAAWEWVRDDAELSIMCVWRHDSIVGICPLVRRAQRVCGLKLWRLEFLTVPDTQYCDFLCASADARDILEAVSGALQQTPNHWDSCVLTHFEQHSSAGQLPYALQRKALKFTLSDFGGNPFVNLEGDWESFYAQRSRRLKKSNNLIANRLKRLGKIDVTWIKEVDAEGLESLNQAIVNISAQSWKTQTGLSLNHPTPQRFIRTLTRLANDNNWLSVWLLKLNGKAIAMEYQLRYQNQVHALRADFDEQYSKQSPGAYLNWKIMENLFNSGIQTYFMGPGKNPYKLRWSEQLRLLRKLEIYSNSWRGRVLHGLQAYVRPMLRVVLQALKPQASPKS